MTIQFTAADAQIIQTALQNAGVEDVAGNVWKLTKAVSAAFQQQFEYEASYLAQDIAAEEDER